MGVQFILFMGIDLGIKLLTMRRMGLWQRLRAAPLSRAFLLGSQVASGAIIAALLFAAIFAAGMPFFGVRIEGSVAGFVGLIVAFACMTADVRPLHRRAREDAGSHARPGDLRHAA